MKKVWLVVLSVVVTGAVMLALMSKKDEDGVFAGDAYKFYYYPKLNTYYDFQNGNFVYTIDGGETWQKKKPKTAKLPETLSDKVMISAPVPEVWQYNEEHREKHNGISTNYLDKEKTRKPKPGEDPNNAPVEVVTSSSETDPSPEVTTKPTDTKPADKRPKTAPKPVQQLPEHEWEAELEVEAERFLNESARRVIKEVLLDRDSS